MVLLRCGDAGEHKGVRGDEPRFLDVGTGLSVLGRHWACTGTDVRALWRPIPATRGRGVVWSPPAGAEGREDRVGRGNG